VRVKREFLKLLKLIDPRSEVSRVKHRIDAPPIAQHATQLPARRPAAVAALLKTQRLRRRSWAQP
jgi:hypothetical protein